MKIDWTKFKNLPKTVGTTGNGGNTIGNTYYKAFPYTKKDWEQVGTLKSSNIEAVPTSVQVGTEWEHYEALQSDATGIPFASYNSIHEAAETVLKSLCVIDANIETYKKDSLTVVTNYIDTCLTNTKTKTLELKPWF